MIVLDAAPVVAFLRDEPAAGEVERILRAGHAAMSSVNLAEATDILSRLHGIDPAQLDALAHVLDVRPPGASEARAAGRLRARHYDRARSPISLADCFLVAAARENDEIATSDQLVVAIARAEGVAVLPLPNSSGVTPTHGR